MIRTKVKAASVIGGTVATILVGFIATWEGLRLLAYKDAVGIPTICYGHTVGVKMTDKMTKAQCDTLLIEDLEIYATGINKCVKVTMPSTRRAALISFAYNVGVPTACKSSVVKLINQGKPLQGCNRLKLYNKAGGKVLKGLTNRREAERKLCIIGAK